jgi:hypothetical protein
LSAQLLACRGGGAADKPFLLRRKDMKEKDLAALAEALASVGYEIKEFTPAGLGAISLTIIPSREDEQKSEN